MAEQPSTAENEKVDISAGPNEELRRMQERAERAEEELERLKSSSEPSVKERAYDFSVHSESAERDNVAEAEEAELRRDSMMAHLMDSLDAGKDIGHYGRLVFAMVARHFLSGHEVIGWLTRDPDFSQEQATLMLRQVENRDYNPPKRERLIAWQAEQEFPILPNPEDPDCGNLYRNLKLPDSIYHHIEEYQEQKVASESAS
jgi:hypothetical protein